MKTKYFIIAVFALITASVPVAAQVDIEKLGRPLGWDDSVDMKNRLVYFDEGVATKNAPTDRPVIADEEAADFAATAVPLALTMSYLNYKEKLDVAHPYFSDKGWKEYSDMIAQVKLIDIMVSQYYTLSSAAKNKPFIKEKGIDPADGVYYWIIEVPLMLVYTQNSANGLKEFPFEMTIQTLIKRVPSGPTPQNVKIEKWSILS